MGTEAPPLSTTTGLADNAVIQDLFAFASRPCVFFIAFSFDAESRRERRPARRVCVFFLGFAHNRNH